MLLSVPTRTPGAAGALKAGTGWLFHFGEVYEPHLQENGTHICRPSLGDLPSFGHADPWSNVPAFHLAYL
jgi:hypothetical protein